jgi:hypothetical protein
MWPFIVINICESPNKDGNLLQRSGCEDCFTTIPLLLYARTEEIISDKDYNYALI